MCRFCAQVLMLLVRRFRLRTGASIRIQAMVNILLKTILLAVFWTVTFSSCQLCAVVHAHTPRAANHDCCGDQKSSNSENTLCADGCHIDAPTLSKGSPNLLAPLFAPLPPVLNRLAVLGHQVKTAYSPRTLNDLSFRPPLIKLVTTLISSPNAPPTSC